MVPASYGAEVKTRSVQWGHHCKIHREESQKSETQHNHLKLTLKKVFSMKTNMIQQEINHSTKTNEISLKTK